jgi:hypothetical protein
MKVQNQNKTVVSNSKLKGAERIFEIRWMRSSVKEPRKISHSQRVWRNDDEKDGLIRSEVCSIHQLFPSSMSHEIACFAYVMLCVNAGIIGVVVAVGVDRTAIEMQQRASFLFPVFPLSHFRDVSSK